MQTSKFSQSKDAILEDGLKKAKKRSPTVIPARFMLTIMITTGCIVIYTQRVNINIAIVAMVNNTRDASILNSSIENFDTCQVDEKNIVNTTLQSQVEGKELFDWSLNEQGIILGGFYYGYVVSNLIGGRLSENFGPKNVFVGGILASSLFTFLIPVAARYHMGALVAVRALIGCAQGMSFPAIFTFFPIWYPQKEVATHLAISMAGLQVGTILTMAVSGYLCEQMEFAGGWPSVFYVFGLTGCVYSLIAAFVMYSRPEDHPNISEAEIKLIAAGKKVNNGKKRCVPWKALLTSAPVWALVFDQIMSIYAFHIILTRIPAYLDGVLKYSIQNNGLVNAILYLSKGVTTVGTGYISDLILKKGFLSVTALRKIFESIAMIGIAVFLAAIPLLGCDADSVVVMLAMAMAISGFNSGGNVPATTEIAPAFTGTIFGICNTFAAATGFIAPLVVGFLLEGNAESLTQWSYVFYSSAAVCIIGMIVFIVFGTAEKQNWAETKDEDEDEEEESTVEKY